MFPACSTTAPQPLAHTHTTDWELFEGRTRIHPAKPGAQEVRNNGFAE